MDAILHQVGTIWWKKKTNRKNIFHLMFCLCALGNEMVKKGEANNEKKAHGKKACNFYSHIWAMFRYNCFFLPLISMCSICFSFVSIFCFPSSDFYHLSALPFAEQKLQSASEVKKKQVCVCVCDRLNCVRWWEKSNKPKLYYRNFSQQQCEWMIPLFLRL